MSAAVPNNASGTVTPGISVAQRLRRKRKITITTRAIVSSRVNSTSCTDAEIVVVRSTICLIWIDAGMAFRQRSDQGILRHIDRHTDVPDTHRGAVLVGDDDVVPGRGLQKLVIVVNREAVLGAVDGSFRSIDGGRGDYRRHVLELNAEGGEFRGIDLHTHRGLLLAADGHDADAGYARDLLRDDCFRRILYYGRRQNIRLHGHHQDR